LAAIPVRINVAPSIWEAARFSASGVGIPNRSQRRTGSPPPWPPTSPSTSTLIWRSKHRVNYKVFLFNSPFQRLLTPGVDVRFLGNGCFDTAFAPVKADSKTLARSICDEVVGK
jgi:hypothetical protein